MFKRIFSPSNKQKGFTLPELLVIIAIVGILAVAIYIHMGSGRSTDVKRISEVDTLRDALKLYHMDHGHYPTSTVSEDWCYLEVAPGNPGVCEGLYDASGNFVLEPYLSKKPGDPLFGKGEGAAEGKTYSYQYISTSSGSGYMIHTDLEERKVRGEEFYEIKIGYGGDGPSAPPPPPIVCGDGKQEGAEVCDDSNTTDCIPYPGCSADCLETQQCGDGDIDCSEECDLGDLGGETCITQGFASGALLCAGDCTFDTSPCSGVGNSPPVAGNDLGETVEDTPVIIDVLANDNDPDGPGEIDPTTVVVQTGPWHGVTSVNPATGQIGYLPSSGYTGTDAFTYTVKDIHGAESNEATVSVGVSAAPPTSPDVSFSSGTYSASENTEGIPITINISKAPTDNPVSVNYGTSDNGATGGANCDEPVDYVATSGTKIWAIGDNLSKTFVVLLCDDGDYEGDERVNLTLSGIVDANIVGTNPATLTIVDDEGCSTCDECNTAIQDASAGDTILLTADIFNQDGNCIDFNGKDGITFDCSSHMIDGDDDEDGYGIYLRGGSDGNTVKNCSVQGFADGIVIESSASTSIADTQSSNNIHYGLRGWNWPSAETISVSNFAASNNGFEGIDLYGFSNGTFTDIETNSNGQTGFKISECESNTFIGIGAQGNDMYGLEVRSSSDNNNLTKLTLANNDQGGLYLDDSKDNIFSDSAITDNTYFDVRLYASSDSNCTNTFSNVVGTNKLPIAYYHDAPAHLSDENFSELILCNADDSTLNNIAIIGSGNNGLWLARTDSSNITNLHSSNNWTGVHLRFSNSNTFSSVTATGNPNGFTLRDSTNNTISDSLISDSWWADFMISNADDDTDCYNNLTNVTGTNGLPIRLYSGSPANVDSQTLSELILCNADGSSVQNTTINGAGNNGLYILRTDKSSFSNIDSSGNHYGLYLNESSQNNFLNISVDNNNDAGVQLIEAGSNYFEDCSIRSNACWGFKVLSGSDNTLVSSRVENTRQLSSHSCAGITVNDSGNGFYNNIIYNTIVPDVNWWDDPFENNSWNVSPPQPGPNIIGGPSVGGNYWRNYGSCSDGNSDGFCDLPYDVEHQDSNCSDTNNCDNLPLAR